MAGVVILRVVCMKSHEDGAMQSMARQQNLAKFLLTQVFRNTREDMHATLDS